MKFLLGSFVFWSLSTGRLQSYLALASDNNNVKLSPTTEKKENSFFGFGGGLDQKVIDYLGNSIRDAISGR